MIIYSEEQPIINRSKIIDIPPVKTVKNVIAVILTIIMKPYMYGKETLFEKLPSVRRSNHFYMHQLI